MPTIVGAKTGQAVPSSSRGLVVACQRNWAVVLHSSTGGDGLVRVSFLTRGVGRQATDQVDDGRLVRGGGCIVPIRCSSVLEEFCEVADLLEAPMLLAQPMQGGIGYHLRCSYRLTSGLPMP